MRPIDADKLRDVLRMRHLTCLNIYGSLGGALSGMIKLLDSQPTLDYAQMIHAHWDYYSGGIIRPHFRCSACGSPRYEHYAVNEFKYCPSCGARMDEEVKE